MASLRSFSVVRLFYRQMSKRSGEVKIVVRPQFAKLKQIQKAYCVHDDVPVYLKGGLKDRLLFQASVGLVLVGLGLSVQVFVRLILGSLIEKEEETDKKEEKDKKGEKGKKDDKDQKEEEKGSKDKAQPEPKK